MGFFSGPSAPAAPPPPPPPPPVAPAANPPTYANAGVQANGASRRQGAAVGAGFEGSLFTGPQGAAAGPQASPQLSGLPGGVQQFVKEKLGL